MNGPARENAGILPPRPGHSAVMRLDTNRELTYHRNCVRQKIDQIKDACCGKEYGGDRSLVLNGGLFDILFLLLLTKNFLG